MTVTAVEPYPPGTRVRNRKRIWSGEPDATVLMSYAALDGTVMYRVRPDGWSPDGYTTWPAAAVVGPDPTPDEPPPVLPVAPPDEHDLDSAFQRFHEAHPEVYATLARLARQAKARGRSRCGIKLLVEVARWEHYIGGGDPYRLNNNHASRFARLLVEREPDLAGFFETRGLRS